MTLKLRNRGVYRLPHNQRKVFAVAFGDEYYLYDVEFEGVLPPRYTVHIDGKLINWFGDFPVWTTSDLFDTGETQDHQASPEDGQQPLLAEA